MKLHLPKRLFTALLTAITLAAAPAALTLGSAAWGAWTATNTYTLDEGDNEIKLSEGKGDSSGSVAGMVFVKPDGASDEAGSITSITFDNDTAKKLVITGDWNGAFNFTDLTVGTLNVNVGGATLNIGGNQASNASQVVTINGMTGSNSLSSVTVKAGSSLTLDGNNTTYTGVTTVEAGATLTIKHTKALGSWNNMTAGDELGRVVGAGTLVIDFTDSNPDNIDVAAKGSGDGSSLGGFTGVVDIQRGKLYIGNNPGQGSNGNNAGDFGASKVIVRNGAEFWTHSSSDKLTTPQIDLMSGATLGNKDGDKEYTGNIRFNVVDPSATGDAVQYDKNGVAYISAYWGKELKYSGLLEGDGTVKFLNTIDTSGNNGYNDWRVNYYLLNAENKFSGTYELADDEEHKDNNNADDEIRLYLENSGVAQYASINLSSTKATSKLILGADSTIVNLNGSVAKNLVTTDGGVSATLTVSGGSFAGMLQNGANNGILSLTKTGAGTLTLSGTNTYSGTTAINAGVLEITNASALSSSSATTIAENASLRINAGTGSTITFGSSNRVTGAGTLEIASGSTVEIGSSANGTANIQTNVKVNGGGTLNLTGADALGWGDTALKKITLLGSGATEEQLAKLTAVNTQTMKTALDLQGNAEVSGGAFEFYGGSITASGKNNVINSDIFSRIDGTITVTNQNDELEISGNFGRRASHQALITKSGLGLLKISGASNVFYQGFTVAQGKVEVAGTGSTKVQGAALTVSSDAEFEVSAGTSTLSGGVTNSGTITVSGGTADFSSAVTNNGAITVSGGTANFTNTLGMGTGSSLSVSGGSATVSGALNVTGTGVQIGQSGNGVLNLTGSMSVAEDAAATLSGAITMGHTITNDGSLTLDGTIYLTGDISSSYESHGDSEVSYALAGGTDSTDKQNGFMTVEGASYYLTQSSDGVANAKNTMGSNFATNTAGDKVVYHGDKSYKVETDSKGIYFSTGDITGTLYYITTGGVVVNNAVQTAATGYTLRGGTMQLTEGSVNTSTITYTSGSITLSDGATLVLDAMPAGMTANSLLSGILSVARDEDESTQIGRLKITQDTTLTAGFEATYTGAVEINNASLFAGGGPGQSVKLASISNFILNDGGELYYHANPTQAPATVDGVKIEYDIQKITVESGTGSFKLQDSDGASLEIGEISINEDATFKFWSNWYDSDLNISALNGAGTFRVESSDDSALSSKVDIDSLAGFTGNMEFVNDTARNLVVTIDTGTSAVNFKSLQTFNTAGTAALTLNVQADTTIGLLSAASGTVNVSANKTLTLGGGTAEDQAQHSIGTLSGTSASVTLGDYATLTLGGGTENAKKQHSIATLTAGAGSMLNLAQHSVLNKVNTINGTVTLTGSGTYNLGALAAMWETGNAASILGVTLADDWSGVVKVSGNTSSSDNDVSGARLADLAKANSWVELDSVEGWIYGNPSGGYDHAVNLILSGTGLTIKTSSERWYGFSKSIKGTGNFTLATASEDTQSYNFTGDISEWAGAFVVNANGTAAPTTTLNLTGGGNLFSGEETSGVVMNRGGVLNVNIGKASADTTMRGSIGFGDEVTTGTLNLTVQGNTEFQKTVDVSQMTVDNGKTATLNAATTVGTMAAGSGSVTLGDSVTLTLGGGTANAQKQHSIGTLSAASAGVTLGDYATLALGGGTAEAQKQHSIGTLTGGTGSKLDLAEHAVLNANTFANGVTLSGSGTLNFGTAENVRTLNNGHMYINGTDSNNQFFNASKTDWTGTVVINGARYGTNDKNLCLNFNQLGNSASKVELINTAGWFSNNNTLATSLILSQDENNAELAAWTITNGSSDGVANNGKIMATFGGNVSGEGTMKFVWSQDKNATTGFKFTGDVSGWTGWFDMATTDSRNYFNLQFEGNANNIAVNVKETPYDEQGNSGHVHVRIDDEGSTAADKTINVNGLIDASYMTLGKSTDTDAAENRATVKLNNTVDLSATLTNYANTTVATGKTLTAGTVSNSGQIKLGEAATVTGGSMSKVQMSNTGITGTAQDGSSSMSDADIEVLAQDASFTIADMTLTNTSITAASVNIENSKVSGNVVLNVVKPTEPITAPTVGQGGTGEISFTYGLALVDSSSTLTLNMEVPQAILPSESGLYKLTITLNGFAEDFDFSNIANQVVFGADSWLGKALQGATPVVTNGSTLGDGAAAAQSASGAPSVSYAATGGNVGKLVITINGLNVPEPTTATLSLLALAALAGRRRRK